MTSLVSSNLNCTWSSPYWRCADNILVVVGLICKAQLSISGLVRCPCQFVITSKQASARYLYRKMMKTWAAESRRLECQISCNVKLTSSLFLYAELMTLLQDMKSPVAAVAQTWVLTPRSELNNHLSYWDRVLLLLIIVV